MPPKKLPSFRAVNDWVLFNCSVIQDKTRTEVEDALMDLTLDCYSKPPDVVLTQSARSRMNGSKYYRTVTAAEAPDLVNCSSFVQWCYGEIGAELPFRTLQQARRGEPVDDLHTLKVGDLIFKTGQHNYWEYANPKALIGHVGMVVDVNSKTGGVIHAIPRGNGVVEVSIDDFLKKNGKVICARRIVPDLPSWLILRIPDKWRGRVFESEDVEMLLYEKLPL